MSTSFLGFVKAHSIAVCLVKCLSNATVTNRAFIDLKGAFDRAHEDVTMEKLIMKGVKGNF